MLPYYFLLQLTMLCPALLEANLRGLEDCADGEDLTKSDADEDEGPADMKLRRRLGFPELDPDALPSSQVTKHL